MLSSICSLIHTNWMAVPSNFWISSNPNRTGRSQIFAHLAWLLYNLLVWTPFLMHMCVCIWWYILQNYNYKLHFQNLSIYHIPHVSIETLAAENLDVCTGCDPWDSNIQLTMGKDWRRLLPLHLDLHLEGFIPKKKEIAENITAGSGNLKTQNLRTSGSSVSPNPHQRTSGFH